MKQLRVQAQPVLVLIWELAQVLIMHTHTTESYEPYQRDYYDDSFTSRTTDMSKNMAAVRKTASGHITTPLSTTIPHTTVHMTAAV